MIPVRLDECELPPAYRELQLTWVDAFDEAGLERLIRSLNKIAEGRKPSPKPSSTVQPERARILHLSDLHFTADDDHLQLLKILDEDLIDRKIDYLVVSGDLSDRCNEAGY